MIHIAILATGDGCSEETYTTAVAYEDRPGFDFVKTWDGHKEAIRREYQTEDSKGDFPEPYDNMADEIINRMINEGWVFPESRLAEVEYD